MLSGERVKGAAPSRDQSTALARHLFVRASPDWRERRHELLTKANIDASAEEVFAMVLTCRVGWNVVDCERSARPRGESEAGFDILEGFDMQALCCDGVEDGRRCTDRVYARAEGERN